MRKEAHGGYRGLAAPLPEQSPPCRQMVKTRGGSECVRTSGGDLDAGRQVWQGLPDLAGLLLVVIATGGGCFQPEDGARMGKGQV